MQSAQSNALVAAFIVLAFIALERGQQWRGALCIGLGAAIKVFPLAALSLAIPRQHRLRFVARFGVIALLLLAAPLLMTSPRSLAAQYGAWWGLETVEMHDYGTSVMGMINTWLGFTWSAWPIQLAGTAVLLLPLVLAWSLWEEATDIRLRFLASLLVYCVIFNHKAEAASYVIAHRHRDLVFHLTPH